LIPIVADVLGQPAVDIALHAVIHQMTDLPHGLDSEQAFQVAHFVGSL
jgi:hypothetical protein